MSRTSIVIPDLNFAPIDLATREERAILSRVNMYVHAYGNKSAEVLRYRAERILTAAAERLEYIADAHVGYLLDAADVFFALAARVEAGMVPTRGKEQAQAWLAHLDATTGRKGGFLAARAEQVAASPVA